MVNKKNSKDSIESSKINKANSDSVESSADSTSPTKMQKIIHSAYDLSLGISIVVAILLGVGLGFFMQKISGSVWLLFLGIFWGIGAALLNIYKAYQRTKKDLESLANDPKYAYHKQNNKD